MASIQDNLKPTGGLPEGLKIGIVVSDYNADMTHQLLESCKAELLEAGLAEEKLTIAHAPGAFELPFVCKQLMEHQALDAVIALGCIIKGETPHFDFIASAVADGIMGLGLQSGIPVVFGVLTTLNPDQAIDRVAGGRRGDKGVEAARTAIHLLTSL